MSHPKQLCLVSTVELTADSKAHHLGQAAWATSSYQEQSDDLKVASSQWLEGLHDFLVGPSQTG